MQPLTVWLPVLRVGSGVDVFTLRLAQGLEKAGHKPVLQWFDRRFELFPSLLKGFKPPKSVDIIHANSWQGFAFKRPGIPLVVTEHHISLNPLLETYHSPMQTIYHRYCVQRWNRLSYGVADAVVAVSRFCAESIQAEAGSKLRIIYNGIDTDHFQSVEGGYVAHQPFRLLFVGNPLRRKGADLLEPLAQALGVDYEVRCLGGLRRDYSSESDGRVRVLPGTLPDKMPDIYRSADAFLALSRFESFGYAALEAMACGLPVLGFARGGTAELCVHGETGLLCEVDDLETLVANIRQLAKDETLQLRFARNARRRAIDCFTESKCVEAYIHLYQEILGI
jgi:glycosyltransferase involved in cell wall biosynthesis